MLERLSKNERGRIVHIFSRAADYYICIFDARLFASDKYELIHIILLASDLRSPFNINRNFNIMSYLNAHSINSTCASNVQRPMQSHFNATRIKSMPKEKKSRFVTPRDRIVNAGWSFNRFSTSFHRISNWIQLNWILIKCLCIMQTAHCTKAHRACSADIWLVNWCSFWGGPPFS